MINVTVACVTPFLNKYVDFYSFIKLIEHLYINGIRSVVVGGTTGEGIALSDSEKGSLFQLVKDVAPEMKVIGCFSSFELCSDKMKVYEKCDFLMVTPQIFIKPPKESIIKYIKELCSIGLNIILYNNPSRVGVSLNGLYDQLYDLNNIVAIKEAGNIENILLYPKWKWLCGNDDQHSLCKQKGFSGIISVCANYAPSLAIKTWNEGKKNDEWNALVEKSSPNPLGIKYLLYKKGIIKSYETRFALFDCDDKV